MMKGIIFMGRSLLKRRRRLRCSIASPIANNTPPTNRFSVISTRLSHSHCYPDQPSFGIAFDIDGVICLGNSPIGRSPQALRKLYHPSSGGGVRESSRAHGLSDLLGVNILQSQILQGHALFKSLLDRYRSELIIAVGKGEPAAVMSEYGFENVLSIDEYAACFSDIDPLAQYKRWMTKKPVDENRSFKKMFPKDSVCSQRVQAAFIVSDSVDWGRDIQVLCDVLRTGGLPGREIGHQPPLYFANDDLEYQASFPSERLGMGAFRIALEAIYNRISPAALEYSSFGKPSAAVFKNAETILSQLASSLHDYNQVVNHTNAGPYNFKTLYMIGDNPSVDINGAREAGHPWFSILTRTGVFKGKENHPQFPADLVVDTVDEAVDYILRKECCT